MTRASSQSVSGLLGVLPRAGTQSLLNFFGNFVRRHEQCLVQVDVALCDTSPRMSQQARYGQFGKAHVSGHAGEGMPEHMGRDVLQLSLPAEPLEDTNNTNEVPVAKLARKDVRILIVARGLSQ